MALVLYTKPGCPYCQQARDHFNAAGEVFTDYDAQNDKSRQAEMLAFSNGDRTVPVVVRDGQFLGSGWGDPPRG